MSLVKAIELLTGETVTILPLDIIRVQLSEDTLKEILSTDELRQLYGY